jgi:hypothetical protein
MLNNLGGYLRNRYSRTGEMADITMDNGITWDDAAHYLL